MQGMAEEIIRVLLKVGERGMHSSKISKHVFNNQNTFFNVVKYEDIHKDVMAFLQRNSKNDLSILQKMKKKGYYRISSDPETNNQLMLQFLPEKSEDIKQETEQSDKSLSLFPDF